MHPFTTLYNSVVVPRLTAAVQYPSTYLVPKVTKVVVNVGVGDTIGNQKSLDDVVALVASITGQKPVQVKARKAIAGFKIRENMVVGVKVTLRGEHMNDFLYKLIQVVLPRTRDFRGLVPSGVTADGNLNIGIKDSMIFPEVSNQGTGHGIQITIVSTATSQDEARNLYESLGFVFQKPEDVVQPTRTRKRK